MKFETIYVLEPSRVQEDYEKFNKDLKIFINQNGAVIRVAMDKLFLKQKTKILLQS